MSQPYHIVVIRLSAMGDVAMTVPVLRVLTATYPQLKITVVSKAFFKPLFDGIPNLQFLTAAIKDEHKDAGLLKLGDAIKKRNVNAVADLHNVLRSKILRNYLVFAEVKSAKIDKGRDEKKQLVKAQGKAIHQLKSTHQRYADVFEKLGFPIDLSTHVFPQRKQLTTIHHDLIGKHTKKLIGIAPFAAHKGKMYPLGLMEAVIKDLNNTGNYKIFLFGGGDAEILKLGEIALKYDEVENVAGTLTFEQELTLISNLDVMLAMDSGNGHLAAMYGIPVLTLWGVTHPYAGFKPFNQPNANQLIANRELYPNIPTSIYGNKYPENYADCMKSIPSELVVKKLEEIV